MRIEKYLKFPIRRYMEAKGFQVWYEVRFMGKKVDLACFKPSKTTASIEAKVRNLDEAVYQASVYLLWSDYSYVAVPRGRTIPDRLVQLIRDRGLGVLRVSGGRSYSVTEEVRPRKNLAVYQTRKRDPVEHLHSLSSGGQ